MLSFYGPSFYPWLYHIIAVVQVWFAHAAGLDVEILGKRLLCYFLGVIFWLVVAVAASRDFLVFYGRGERYFSGPCFIRHTFFPPVEMP